MKIIHWIVLGFSIFFLGACSANPTATRVLTDAPASFTATPGVKPSATPTGVSQSPATSAPAKPTLAANPSTPNVALKTGQPPAGTPAAGIQKMLGDQVVQINAQEMMTVPSADFHLTGLAPSGSVVSVNNDFTVVGRNWVFSFPISLEEGPNLLEVVVSNAQGQQVNAELVVVFDPTP